MKKPNLPVCLYPLVSRYSGWGGGDEGAHKAGFHTMFAADNDEHAIKLFRRNHPDHPIFHADISMMSAVETLKLARIPGGKGFVYLTTAPCQGASRAGKCNPYHPFNLLLLNEPYFISQLRPSAFVFENVKGLTEGKMKVLKTMLMKEVDQWLGDYEVWECILNANDLGVAQARNRYIMIGFRKDLNIIPEFPTPNDYKPTIGDVLHGVDGIRYGYWGKHLRPIDKPSPTLTKTENLWKVVDGEMQKLEEPDILGLCGYPTTWITDGNRRKTFERAGNSVMPPMAEAIFGKIYELLQRAGVEPCLQEDLLAITKETVSTSLTWKQNLSTVDNK